MGLDEGLDGYPERPLKVKIEKRYERALKTRAVDDIIAFLKEWNRRVKINPGKLRRAILDTSLILEKLRGFNIVSVDLSSSINIGGQVKTLRDIILELFRTFSRVSEGRLTILVHQKYCMYLLLHSLLCGMTRYDALMVVASRMVMPMKNISNSLFEYRKWRDKRWIVIVMNMGAKLTELSEK